MNFSLDMWKIDKNLALIVASLLFLLPVTSNAARAGGLIRDAETENLIRDYARPIFKTANLYGHNVKIHIISDRNFNAFVVDGQNMFIHIGAITNSKTPNQLIGVIAHETGHITGGHLARFRSQLKRASSVGPMLILLQRTLLANRRVDESSADQAAVSFLDATHQSSKGMLRTFEYFADQGLGSLSRVNPYLQSHPLPRARISQLRSRARRSPYFNTLDSAELQFRHDMVKAKLIGFLDSPRSVFNQYPKKDRSTPARYARALALYHSTGLKSFLPKINALIAEAPDNPYFVELKGQFLFEGGRPRNAVKPLRKAVSLAPNEPLIRVLLAQALLGSSDDMLVDEAIRHLRKALGREKKYATGYRQLANAYARKRKISSAELASAQAYFYEGRLNLAKQQAKRAKKKFKNGSAKWLIADDILKFQRPKH